MQKAAALGKRLPPRLVIFIVGLCLGQFVRGCAYVGGNGFYLFAKANSVICPNFVRLRLALTAA